MGSLADRLGRRPLVLVALAAYAVANIGSEQQYLAPLVEAGVVRPFVVLLGVPDEDVVILSLAFLSSIVRHHREVYS